MKQLRAYLELTKPRLTSMVILTTWLGYAFATPGVRPPFNMGSDPSRFFHTLIGSWLTAGGAAALNEYLEWDKDALMRRTQSRPLPQKRLSPEEALWFGLLISALGILQLTFFVNLLTSLLAMLSLGTYLLVYTPLKTRTSLCTLVGAIPGAIPPMMGWTGARNAVEPGAWVLFAILFLWQLPHFLAIAWMYREDYARAGFPMLPVIHPDGASTGRMIILYTAVLVPVTLIPARLGLAGFSYFWAALVLGMVFFTCGVFTAFYRTAACARRLLVASVLYLPTLLTWMACNKVS
jgi:protoheme IX farnesyltransferase